LILNLKTVFTKMKLYSQMQIPLSAKKISPPAIKNVTSEQKRVAPSLIPNTTGVKRIASKTAQAGKNQSALNL